MSIIYENTEINFFQNLYVHIKTYQFALEYGQTKLLYQ